jgi:polyisoprenoid-binding protein YceI
LRVKLTHAAILFAACSSAALAAPEGYTIDSSHTYPSLEIIHFGASVFRGKFTKTTGKAVVDRAAKTGSLDISIDPASIDMGHQQLNGHLRTKDFFNVEQFPTITYKSDAIKFNGDTPASVEGNLTMLGVTRPVNLSLNWFKCYQHPVFKKEVCGADATAAIKRTEFGMKFGVPTAVSDEVKLQIQVEAVHD